MQNTLGIDPDFLVTGLFRLWRTLNLASLLASLFMPWSKDACCPQSMIEFSLNYAGLGVLFLRNGGIMLAFFFAVPTLLLCTLIVYIGISAQEILFTRPKGRFWLHIALAPWIFLASILFISGSVNSIGFWLVFIGLGSSVLLEAASWLFDWASAFPDASRA